MAETLTWSKVFAGFAEENEQKSIHTARFYHQQAAPFFRWLDDNGVLVAHKDEDSGELRCGLTRQRILQFVNKVDAKHKTNSNDGKGLKTRSKNAVWRAVRAVFYWATGYPDNLDGEHLLPKTFWFKIKPNRIESDLPYRIRDDKKWLKIYAALDTSLGPVRDRAIVELILSSGLRRKEVANLKWSHITWHEGRQCASVFVDDGKGGKDRETGFGNGAYTAMVAWRTELCDTLRISPDDISEDLAVFPAVLHAADRQWVDWIKAGAKGKPPAQSALAGLNEHSLSTIFFRLTGRAGIRVTAHSLRHTCARRWLAAGMTPTQIQRKLGHSKLETTMRYLEIDDEEAQDALLDILEKKAA